jgi:DNA polymerase-3 subunit delta'
VADPWSEVVGQEEAVRVLRAASSAPVHAYLFVGPPGAGKRPAARAFAAALLSEGLDAEASERAVALALAERHPDLVIIEPEGNQFKGGRGRSQPDSETTILLREIAASPREGTRKVIVADRFDTATPEAIGRLLKAIEEPPDSAIVILLEEEVPPEQATISSRCARVDFGPLPPSTVAAALVAQGTDPADAAVAAEASAGDLRRARLLADDATLRQRSETWRSVPFRLDGRGATVMTLVHQLDEELAHAQVHLEEVQAAESAQLEAQVEVLGERGSGRKAMLERHARQKRQVRTDELRYGLATLASTYRERLASSERPDLLAGSLDALDEAGAALVRNPIEPLLLERLFLRLEPLAD